MQSYFQLVKPVEKSQKEIKWTEFKSSVHINNCQIIITQFLVIDNLAILSYSL